MRVFWYVSKTKVDSFASDSRWTDRVGARVRVSLPLMISVEAEATGQPDPGLLRKLERIEKDARRDQGVLPVAEIGSDPPVLFRYEGKSARIAFLDTFWVAAVDGTTAVLLTGWAGNAIGGPHVQPSAITSSVNPLTAVEELTKGVDDQRMPARLSEAWATIFRDGSHLLGNEALPRTTGLVVYAGWQHADEENITRSGWTEPIHRVVVGSPIFVEQIVAAARPS